MNVQIASRSVDSSASRISTYARFDRDAGSRRWALSKATGSTWSAGTNSVTSISCDYSTGRLARSSLVRMTISPSSDSYALAMSEDSTSSPLSSHTFL